jgi:hypothetical protein
MMEETIGEQSSFAGATREWLISMFQRSSSMYTESGLTSSGLGSHSRQGADCSFCVVSISDKHCAERCESSAISSSTKKRYVHCSLWLPMLETKDKDRRPYAACVSCLNWRSPDLSDSSTRPM